MNLKIFIYMGIILTYNNFFTNNINNDSHTDDEKPTRKNKKLFFKVIGTIITPFLSIYLS